MRNAVLVSYHFPPQGGRAVQRASKLAKHLPDYGWRPIVFAMPEGRGRMPMDPSLCAKLPADGGVLTLGHNATVSGFHDPAPVLKALRLMLRQGLEPGSVRAVFTTSEYGRKRFSGFGDLVESGMLEVRGCRPHRKSIADLARLDVSLLRTRGDAYTPARSSST